MINKNKYLIAFENTDFDDEFNKWVLVYGDDKEEAIYKYAKNIGVKDRAFLEDIYYPQNTIFLGRFYIDEYGESFEPDGGIEEVVKNDNLKARLEEKLRKFFRYNREYADIYIDYLFTQKYKDNEDLYNLKYKFDDEMLLYIFLNDEINSYEIKKICEENIII